MQIWAEPFTKLRVPKMFDLRADPYELADITSNTYYDWVFDHAYLVVPAQAYVADFLATFTEYPPSQRAGELLDRPDRAEPDGPAQRRRRPVAPPTTGGGARCATPERQSPCLRRNLP